VLEEEWSLLRRTILILVFYYLSAFEIWPVKEGCSLSGSGLVRRGIPYLQKTSFKSLLVGIAL